MATKIYKSLYSFDRPFQQYDTPYTIVIYDQESNFYFLSTKYGRPLEKFHDPPGPAQQILNDPTGYCPNFVDDWK